MLSGNSNPAVARGVLRAREHDARLRRHREPDGVDLAHAVQARERQQNLPRGSPSNGVAPPQ